MPIRCALTKATGSGEQIVIDVCQWNPVTGDIQHKDFDEMAELVDQGLAFADIRLKDMNMRMIEAYNLEEYFTPGEWQKVVSILDILAGNQSAALVRQRWDAIKEENADLERHRQEAYEHHQQAQMFADR